MLLDIALQFATEAKTSPDFAETPTLAHGRIEQRAIWTTTALNDYVNFPGVGQVFMIRRTRQNKKSGKTSIETAWGVTSHTPNTANAKKLLLLNRGHWCIENTAHHCLDWSFDEDRCRIRTGYGPENTTRLRRFAIELIKARGLNVAETLRRLNRNVRCVLDFLKMTANCQPKLNRLNAPPYRHPAPGSPPGPQPRALTTRDHQTQSAHSPHPHAPSLRTASPTSHDNRHKRRDAINLRKNQRMN